MSRARADVLLSFTLPAAQLELIRHRLIRTVGVCSPQWHTQHIFIKHLLRVGQGARQRVTQTDVGLSHGGPVPVRDLVDGVISLLQGWFDRTVGM